MMRSTLRAAVPLTLVVSAIAVSPAAAQTPAPTAHAAGGAPTVVTYPSVVQVRVDRTERALRRASKQIENGSPVATVASTLKVVRRQMSSAWRGAKYVVKNAPPPPAADARVHAHVSGAPLIAPTGTYASPADTGFYVLALQDEVVAATVQLIDGAHGTGLDAISKTLNFALDRRDSAIKDILVLAPPAPPAASDARVHAHAAGTPAGGSTFDALMPTYVPVLDDELQTIQATTTDATDLTVGGKRLLTAATAQVTKTRDFVNTTWPPLPAG
jgi:hypothetical protein